MSLLVYALAARDAGALRTTGVARERLTVIPVGRLAAVVGVVSRPPRPTMRRVQQYDWVVRSLWKRRSAVLPVRFGTLVRDRAALEATVRDRQATFIRQLAFIRNRAQMTVRLVPGSGNQEPDAEDVSVSTAGRSRGRRYLEARARMNEVPGFGPVRDAVRRWIRAERVERHGGVATVYHLVPRSAATRYRQAIERAARAQSLRLHVSGPWPPYAFAEYEPVGGSR